MQPPLDIAFSPCPNDTFIFHAWVKGLVGKGLPASPILADVQQLNAWAMQSKHSLTKLSMHCLGKVLDDYILLPVGAALGEDCGPKIIAKKSFPLEEISSKNIAIPGRDTTAHLLLDILLEPRGEKHFCLYHEIVPLLQKGVVDAGLIIHENRFTFEQQGFVEVADLGKLWRKRFGLPLPLGGLAAKRQLGRKRLQELSQIIQESLKMAWLAPEISKEYVLEHSQEKDFHVIKQHIDLYVNSESLCLSEKGIQAINELLSLGRERGLLPKCDAAWLFKEEAIL